MEWNFALAQPIIGNPFEQQLQNFLLNELPKFNAPVDVDAWARQIPTLQRDAIEKVYLRGFPKGALSSKPQIEWTDTLQVDDSYIIRKLRYEAFTDYWIPALLYEPTQLKGKAPVVLNPNGHHAGGKAVSYKQARCINLAKRGMIALNMEFIGMGELSDDRQHNNIAHLNLTGMAGAGLFYLALKKGLDVLLAHKHADRKRCAVTGLSGGGWQTIVISALDPRVTASIPVAGYTSNRMRVTCGNDLGDQEQVPVDMSTVADYQTLTAMLAPRPALLIMNHNDNCCFATPRTKPVIYDAVKPTYEAFGKADVFESHNNMDPGSHNYDADNRTALYRFLNKHFDLDTPDTDIHRDDELLPEHRLNVGLPDTQQTMLNLAITRAKALAHKRKTPRTAADRRKLRDKLRQCLHLPSYRIRANVQCENGYMKKYLLHTGPWTLAAFANLPENPTTATLAIADGGKSTFADANPTDDHAMLIPEIFGTGQYEARAILRSLVETAGHRQLGVQVAQILAAAEFFSKKTAIDRIELSTMGVSCSFAGLIAAALEPRRFSKLIFGHTATSLMHLLTWPERYEACPPLYCFGLLQIADGPELQALLEGVTLEQPARAVPPSM